MLQLAGFKENRAVTSGYQRHVEGSVMGRLIIITLYGRVYMDTIIFFLYENL